jgi:hypothetical protein
VTPRGWLAGAIVVVAAGAVVGVGAAVQPPPSASQQPAPEQQPLTGIALVCPAPAEVPEAAATVDAVALPDPGVPTSGLDGPPVLALSSLGETSGTEPLAETDERGVSVTAPLDQAAAASAAATATGPLAPGLASQVTVTAAGQRTSGLASTPCVEPQRDWWFVAGSGQVGRRATLVLGNTADGAAVVDIEVWSENGLLSTSGTSDLGIPPRGSRTVAIDAVADGAERLAVHVTATVGKVGAGLVVREVDGANPVGLAWATPSEAPDTLAYIPGLPGFGDRTLRLLNPGDEDAIVGLRVLSGASTFTPIGLEAIDVPAATVVDVDLAPAGQEAFALELSSTVPVASAVRLTQTPASGLGDFALVGSAPVLDGLSGTRVTLADGRSARVVLSALPEEEESTAAVPTPTDAIDAGESPNATDAPTAEPETTDISVELIGLDGTRLDERVATVARGTTGTFPVELPAGQTDAWVVLRPEQEGIVLAGLEATTTVNVPDPLDPAAQREAFWLDIVSLRSVRTSVDVPPVLPDVGVGLPR